MRIRLEFPETVLFSFPIRPRVTDMNYADHVGNDRFLIYAQEARAAWLAAMDYREINVEGCTTIVADAAIQFLAEAFAGDELTVELALGGWHKYGFDLMYRIVRGDDVVAIMKTALLMKDNVTGALVAPPEGLVRQVKALEVH